MQIDLAPDPHPRRRGVPVPPAQPRVQSMVRNPYSDPRTRIVTSEGPPQPAPRRGPELRECHEQPGDDPFLVKDFKAKARELLDLELGHSADSKDDELQRARLAFEEAVQRHELRLVDDAVLEDARVRLERAQSHRLDKRHQLKVRLDVIQQELKQGRLERRRAARAVADQYVYEHTDDAFLRHVREALHGWHHGLSDACRAAQHPTYDHPLRPTLKHMAETMQRGLEKAERALLKKSGSVTPPAAAASPRRRTKN